MKKRLGIRLPFILLLMLTGCSSSSKTTEVYMSDDVSEIQVSYFSEGSSQEWTVSGEQVTDLKGWIDSLQYEPYSSEQDAALPDNDNVIEAYHFAFSENDSTDIFYINTGDEYYLRVGDTYYTVKNPSSPPVEEGKPEIERGPNLRETQ